MPIRWRWSGRSGRLEENVGWSPDTNWREAWELAIYIYPGQSHRGLWIDIRCGTPQSAIHLVLSVLKMKQSIGEARKFLPAHLAPHPLPEKRGNCKHSELHCCQLYLRSNHSATNPWSILTSPLNLSPGRRNDWVELICRARAVPHRNFTLLLDLQCFTVPGITAEQTNDEFLAGKKSRSGADSHSHK